MNVAVIGFGFMGITHALAILRNPSLKLVAIITRDIDAVETKLQQQTGNFSSGEIDVQQLKNVPRYTSLSLCMQDVNVDIVHICTHTDLHFSMAEQAITKGLHVFLEKPMTLHPDEGKELIRLSQQYNVKLMVGHVLRFMPAYEQLKTWIDTQEFGALTFLSLTRFTGLPSWGQWKEKRQSFGSSGGALFDLLIHDIDFLQYAIGVPERIESVTLPGALSNEDYISAQWYYKGMTAKVEGGNIFHSQFPFQAAFMAHFEKASVTYTSLKPETIQVCTDEKTEHVPAGDANEGFYREIDYFASCVANDQYPERCTPESSLRTIELCYRHIRDAS